MNNIKKNVTQVMFVFLILFFGLISYIAYFQVFKSNNIANMPSNPRLWAMRNQVLRGTVYSRGMEPLTKTERLPDGKQKLDYLYGPVFAHTVGYMSPTYGLEGLEATFDKQLSTYDSQKTTLEQLTKNFTWNNLKSMFFNRDSGKKQVGNSIVTTLDLPLQQVAYKALGNQKGAVVALDPKTGQVLAMVSTPSFDPNDLKAVMEKANKITNGDDSPLFDRATQGLFPPGSTFKVVTSTSALNHIPGVDTEIFNDSKGYITFPNGAILHDNDFEKNGYIDLQKAFVVSSNVVFGTLAMELGNTQLRDTAEKFGFNQNIPAIGFSIKPSVFAKLNSDQVGMIAQSGIGQGYDLATPIQMALVASTVANDGVMMTPKLVSKVINKDGKTIQTFPNTVYRKVMTQQDAQTIKGFMTALVKYNMSGGYWPFFAGYDVAAKTGTATKNGSKPDSWLECFAPANNPKIAIAVIVEGGGYGAGAASDVAGKVMQAYLGPANQ